MKKVLSVTSLLGILLLPVVAFAAFERIGDFIGDLVDFVNDILVPAVFALAFLMFLWGVAKAFIISGDDESSRTEGKQYMLWAIIGFVLMVSVWGIVNLLSSSLALDEDQIQGIPQVPSLP